MKKIKKTLLIAALFVVINSAGAEESKWLDEIRPGSSLCTTREYLKNFIKMKSEGNEIGRGYYIKEGYCAISTPGTKIKVISSDWETTQISIDVDGKATERWAISPAVLK